jgi:RNA polymerase sigma factor (sigma-70 family)
VTKIDDQRLARRATRGDRRAFEAIFRHHHQGLYRFCMAIVADPQDAQEALQNTMVKVLRSLPGERRRIELKPWLFRIARNEAVETLRRRRDTVELTPERAGSSQEIAETAADRERLRRLLADLGELPERQRDALLMRELAGLGFEEIAAALGTSAATARQAVYEARLNLHRMEEGRAMRCDAAMLALSEDDGRVMRRRELQAHLRDCASCRAFRGEIEERRTELAALAPLPALAAAGMLHALLGGSAQAAVTGAGGGVAASVSAGAGKAVATSALVKAAAGVAIVATIGVSTAAREGLVDIGAGNAGWDPAAQPPAGAPREGVARAHPGTTGARPRHARGGDAQAAGAPAAEGAGLPPVDRPAAATARGSAREARGTSRHSEARGARSRRGRARSPGHPAQRPEASTRGRETAAAHRAPRGNPSPGAGPRSESNSAPAEPQPPAVQPPPEASPPEPEPASPPAGSSPPPPPDKAVGHSSSPPSGSP